MRKSLVSLAITAVALIPLTLHAQQQQGTTEKSAATKPAGNKSSAQKIANAMSAAPNEIAKHATIMDWPAKEGGKPTQLRAGTNGWVCFPNSPGEYGAASVDDPMCLDKQWQAWGEAWMGKTQPKVTGTGIGYMLKGDRGASNTDPFATGRTADNNWVVSPAHIMVLYEDTKILDAFPTDPNSGGPWVMWKGTPYAHLMVPVSPTKMATMKGGGMHGHGMHSGTQSGSMQGGGTQGGGMQGGGMQGGGMQGGGMQGGGMQGGGMQGGGTQDGGTQDGGMMKSEPPKSEPAPK